MDFFREMLIMSKTTRNNIEQNPVATNPQGANAQEDLLEKAIKPSRFTISPASRRMLGGIAGAIALSLLTLSVLAAAVPTAGGSVVLAALVTSVIVGAGSGAFVGDVKKKTLSMATVVGLVAGGIIAGPPGAILGAMIGASVNGAVEQITGGRSINTIIISSITPIATGLQRVSANLTKVFKPSNNLTNTLQKKDEIQQDVINNNTTQTPNKIEATKSAEQLNKQINKITKNSDKGIAKKPNKKKRKRQRAKERKVSAREI